MNIAVFYHVFAVNNWRLIFDEQLETLKNSGLLDVADDVIINFVGSDYDYSVGRSIVKILGFENIELIHDNRNQFEYSTLRLIKQYAEINDAYVLYFHAKGTANMRFAENSEAWRKFMEYFLIEDWSACIQKLQLGFDCCGVNFFDKPKNHFSGNFWWSTTDYIKKLPKIKRFDIMKTLERLFHNGEVQAVNYFRRGCEYWIGNKKPKAHSFCQNGNAYYATKIEESEYKRTKELVHD